MKVDEVKDTLRNGVKKVIDGDMGAETGRSIAYMACKYIAAIKLEIEYAKVKGDKPSVSDLNPT